MEDETLMRLFRAFERAQHRVAGRTESSNHADGLAAEAAYLALSELRAEIEDEFRHELRAAELRAAEL